MGKKKNTDNVYVLQNEESLSNTNREPIPYEELEWRVKDFVGAAAELIAIQDSLIRNERRYSSAKDAFDFTLKLLRDTMKNNKGVSDKDH